ncbi:hypothetical protein C6P08_07415 [Weissella confusa]|uniref:Glycosyltransferase n=1 Tax=Weissella confusa TaxID=1583 RepID=A0AAJ3DB15_WEICO|nr:glycosyltransferase [Weissella confusa]MBJ7694917.1 glycosyltransferase [Weissella confusa]NBA11235.1 glycosyltransferase [Weissella confusa]QBZ05025.1 hypothetical protein C6P08_07415 [Weissella confusa]
MRKFKKLLRKVKNQLKNRHVAFYVKNYEKVQVDKSVILYESRDGKSFSDSPLAFFKYLYRNPEFLDFKHVWVYDENTDLGLLKESLGVFDDRVTFVGRNTIEYSATLLRAGYLINNSTFQAWVSKKDAQIYVNTWHGTPLKKMGFDLVNDLKGSQNVLRNFMMSDYLVSPNAHTSEIFLDAYRLRDAYNGVILEGGYPRIDATFSSIETFNVVRKLEKYVAAFKKDLPIILYTPTYRGVSDAKKHDDIAKLSEDLKVLVARYSERANVLIKVHPFVYERVSPVSSLSPYLIPDSFDTNELLGVTDVLITDYSSVFFDFLVTNKPVIFYVWDRDEYSDERGMYLSENELPGVSCVDTVTLITAIDEVLESGVSDLFADRYASLQRRMTGYEDGAVTARYVERIFNDKDSDKINEIKANSDKIKLLFYPGGLLTNGITTAFTNLVNALPGDKYDITVMIGGQMDDEKKANVSAFANNVRPMFVFGSSAMTVVEKVKFLSMKFLPWEPLVNALYSESGFTRESKRLLPAMTFDTVIDYSGYSMFPAPFLLEANADKRLIYLHNDMIADANRKIGIRYPLKRNVTGAIALYDRYDYLVNVSEAVKDINQEKLSNRASVDKFVTAENLLDYDRILSLANETAPNWVSDTRFKFVTVGRLSPEKNHKELLKAWQRLVVDNDNLLLIIVGYGPLEAQLKKLATRLNISSSVIFTGRMANPYPAMKAADAFVFPSLWEGQGLSLLEAMILEKPVVVSDIPTSREIVSDKYGIIADGVDEFSLSKAMVELITEKNAYSKFDYVAYNQNALVHAEEILGK